MKMYIFGFLKKTVALFCIILILFSVINTGICGMVFAAEDFEAQITQFPESYKVYLRQLHEKYPRWKFVAVDTGLEWSEVIAEESKENRNLVPKSASDFVKSRNPGDYIPETDTYIEKDKGWVAADEIVVSHFMDPRNFLNESDIFQFELLSFDEAITVATVEEVLKNTFMHETKIAYYDSQGNLVNTDKTYAETIYEAGEAYNVNPCYLASKIRNEVVVSGGGGSGSVSGKYEGYEGIYNFYNIGANDGETPIKNGLEWARNNDGTYMRPWTTPKKSIYGGACWLAEKYIAKGQDTGYFQKFNVTPSSDYPLYTHQYMTNVSGADSQGYSTYLSYRELDLLDSERVFSIPVFDNMPGEAVQSESVVFENVSAVSGFVNYSSVNMRSTASTGGSVVAKLPYGTKVKILGDSRVNSLYYAHYLNNPFWCRIEAELNGKIYTGYMSVDYLTLDASAKITAESTLELSALTDNGEKPSYFSSDELVAVVDENGVVTAKKCGRTEIYATTSKGGFDIFALEVDHIFGSWTLKKQATCKNFGEEIRECLYCGCSETRAVPGNVHVNFVTDEGTEATCRENGYTAGSYCYDCEKWFEGHNLIEKLSHSFKTYISDENSTCTADGTKTAKCDNCDAEDTIDDEGSALDHSFTNYVSNNDATCTEDGTKTAKCDRCDAIDTVVDKGSAKGHTEIILSEKSATYTSDGKTVGKKCTVCGKVTVAQKTLPKLTLSKVDGLNAKKIKVAKSSEITLSWNKVDDGVKYEVYRYTNKKWKLIKTTSKTSYTVKKLKADKSYKFKVRAVVEGAKPGAYSKILTVETIPLTTSLKLKSGKKQLTASWNKVSDISGYEVQYSTSKKFSKKNTKTVTVKKSSKKTTLKSLKKGKKYYVRIRTYKTVNNKKIYSEWSKVKNVKIK